MKKLLLPLMIVSLVGLAFGQRVNFDTQIQPIFNNNCVGCHSAGHGTGLNLTTGNSFALLVDHVSSNYNPALRVVSGDSTTSVLYNKIANTGVNGGLMPQGGPQLSAANIHLIATWIAELPISISEAQLLASGEVATVTGVVISPNFGTAGSYTELAIQDPTGGLVIFSNTFDSGLSIGDSVIVTGTISIYSGTIELVPSSPAAITVVSSDNTLPAFQEVNLEDFMANYDDYESELIVVDSVSIVGGTWPSPGGNSNITITDPTGTISTMRIDKDSDLDENSQPLGYFVLQGLGADFNNGQIKPRFYSDIMVIGDPPPAITNVMHFPASPGPADDVLVSATIQDNGSVDLANMVYTVDGGGENTVSMTANGTTYSATIPAQAANAVVTYWVSAMDEIGGTSESAHGSYVVYSGSVNSIASIQDGTIPTGTVVTIQGIVTAESWAFDSPDNLSHFFIQDDEAAYSGIKVYESGVAVAQGDEVRLTGEVDEYFGLTEIINLDSMEILSHNHRVNPVVVPITTTDWEPYEGVLITVEDVTVSNPDLGFGEWSVTDGTNELVLDDDAKYYYYPVQDEALASVTGVLDYSFNVYKLQPRLTNDIVTADGLTSIQAFQQVRYSDLFPAEQIDGNLHVSDSSYMYRDTLTIRGIVTMPTGLSYAGAGIKFLFQDVNGGPWSSVMSYDPDSSAFPVLYEGDLIEATGYVEEYTTDRSAMTEFFITQEVELIDVGLTPPPPAVIPTGDLRWPTTAEQWGTSMVTVENVTITGDLPTYELFAVDDGSGSVLVDDDSDSLANYITPPPGTEFSSITGWVYNHYGYYEDSTAYKLEPLYEWDLVLLNAVGDEPVVPNGYALRNYPNPFNPTTTIAYRIPEASPVKLVVYNQLGRIVKVVANGYQAAGDYEAIWDGTNNSGQKVSSGVYFYRLVAGQHDMVAKMVMLK